MTDRLGRPTSPETLTPPGPLVFRWLLPTGASNGYSKQKWPIPTQAADRDQIDLCIAIAFGGKHDPPTTG